jgi:hypothetical protein
VRDGLIAGMAPLSDPTRRHGRDAAAFAAGLGLTALAGTVADRHPSADRRVFAALNDREPGPVVPRLLQ